MANSKLEGKYFPISNKMVSFLVKNLNSLEYNQRERGVNIIKNIINTKKVSYENSKRILNLYQTGDDRLKKILGGEDFINFLNSQLERKRDIIYKRKDNKRKRGESNAFIKSHTKNENKIFIVKEEILKQLKNEL